MEASRKKMILVLCIPISDVNDEFICAKILNIYVFQMSATLSNSITTNLRQIVGGIAGVGHDNGAPHERVLAYVPSQRAHLTCTHQNFHNIKLLQYVCCHISWKFQPVWPIFAFSFG